MLDGAGAFERDLSDGLADYERDILSRFDRGDSVPEIAAAIGLSPRSVGQVVSLYDDRPGPDPRPQLELVNAAFVARVERAKVSGGDGYGGQRSVLDLATILDRAADQADRIFLELFPNAVKRGSELTVGDLAGSPGRKVSMNVGHGPKRGVWRNFAGHEGGDVLNLVETVLCGGNRGEAVKWLKSYLKLDDLDPARIEQHRIEARRNSERRVREGEETVKRDRARAAARWHEAVELAAGDPVDLYLRARGIDWSLLPRRPGVLRYHPALQYGPSPEDGSAALKLPAMVAQVTALDGAQIATHRTYLDPHGPRKAAGDLLGHDAKGRALDAKKVMGAYLGGHIPVWKGRHRCPLRDIPAGTDVWAAEGIEDALTAACARPEERVIALLALGNLAAIDLPPQMGRLILLKQNDPPGSDAARLFDAGVKAQRARGHRVAWVEAPAGVKDLNELAQREAGVL